MSHFQRLAESEYAEDLELLARCDRLGRVPGAVVCGLNEALEYLRELAMENESA